MLQVFGGPEGCLDAIWNVDFLKDIIQMGLNRMRTDAKHVGNLIICGPHCDLGKYLDLPWGQVRAAAL